MLLALVLIAALIALTYSLDFAIEPPETHFEDPAADTAIRTRHLLIA